MPALWTLPTAALAAALCDTPAVLEALRGEAPAPHTYALTPPPQVGPPGWQSPPPGSGRSVYGIPYEDHIETEHFTINWAIPGLPLAVAESAGAALENAWTAFVETSGWTPPVSSDLYYIWVLLDPSLGSTTGYTAEYFTDLYPEGYPVIWLNPDWAYDTNFWAALSAHELMHTLQFALRDWSGSYEGESWYWEASATWACELADPAVDGHQYTSAWYANQTGLRYDSTEGSHHYGIFVFNAWMEEHLTGPEGMRAVWEASADRPLDTWDVLLSDVTGADISALWGGFTGAYGNRQLAESALYTEARRAGFAADGEGGELPYLGTHYWQVTAEGDYSADGGVVLSGAGGPAEIVRASAGEVLAVTALADKTLYTLRYTPIPEEDTGEGKDTEAPEDTGGPEGSAHDTDLPDTDSPAPEEETASPDSGEEPSQIPMDSAEEKGGCACAAGGATPLGISWIWALWALRRRRGGARQDEQHPYTTRPDYKALPERR